MPKKHTPSYTTTKPTYVHPSLQSSRPSSSAAAPPPQTVNERIQQLRREQTPRAGTDRRDEITEVVTHRTVPPALRRILHMAEVDAPRPKPGSRPTRRSPLRPGERPPPGPAAPSSWLQTSRHAPAHVRNLRRRYGGDGMGPTRFCKLARVNDEEYNRLPPNRSLAHQCLRTLAMHWEDLAEYEQHYLPSLPIPLKEALLSYLSLYGRTGCVDMKTFKILFQTDKEVESASGSDEVRFLDLTHLLNERYTLRDLEKSLQNSAARTSQLAALSLGSVIEKLKGVEVAESWEDEAEELFNVASPIALSVPSFPNLTRLSLAHPGPSASWADLLAISPKLKTLTHLSLAYWPRPSTTPNAATASMVGQHATVSLGGSHFYSDLDDDWHEAANILRRLSLNTYCLKWLDLEGCTWHKALTWNSPSAAPRIPRSMFSTDSPEWRNRPSAAPGPDWNGAWRQIEYLNLFQGWLPSDRGSLQTLPAGVVPVQLMSWLRENEDKEEVKEMLNPDPGHDASDWVDREKVARNVEFSVQALRRAGGGKWCAIDHGWGD